MAKYDPKKLKEYEEIIVAKMGLITHIAPDLKVTPKTIHQWRKDHKEFAEIFDRANEFCLDKAESKLFKNIDDGKEASKFFYLKCKGKPRGYIEKEVVAEISISGKDIRYDHESMSSTIPKA